jgi:DNA-binding MurR/RpiR family transcriptional regulator
MLVKIEAMLNEFAKIRTIASKLDTQVVTVYRYANHLGYKNVMISTQEMDMIVKHRAGLIKAKINTDAPASTTSAAVEPTVQALD